MSVRFPLVACSTVEACEPGCPNDVGDTVNVRYHLNDDAAPADGTVALSIRLPDGTVVTPPVERIAVGEYHCDYQPVQSGQHFYRYTSTGAVVDATQGAFLVRTQLVN